MLPRAYIIHQLRTRIRLRIPEMRQDQEFFDEVLASVASISGVSDVRTNPVTASVLVSHPELGFDKLQPAMGALELFEMVPGMPPAAPSMSHTINSISRLDQAISAGSSGSVDLRTLAFTGIVGLSIHQMLRGNFTGPAIPMLLSAVDLAQRYRNHNDD